MDEKTRNCRKCRVDRPMSAYRAYTRGRWNTVCDQCPQEVKRTGRGPWEVPYPCVSCGKHFASEGIYSRVVQLKYCSAACRDGEKRTALYRCSRCCKTMHADAFPRRQRSRSPKTICLACEPKARLDVPPHERPRTGPGEMYRAAMGRANRESRAFALTAHQVRVMYRSAGCSLCGGAIATLRAIRPGPLSQMNCRGYCRRCLRMLGKLSHEELIAFGRAVAAHCHPAQEAAHAVTA